MAETLAEALQREITRVRDEIMPGYIEIGEAGRLTLTLMRKEMDCAVKALAEQDASACLTWLRALKEYEA